jgi:hypothetical protein
MVPLPYLRRFRATVGTWRINAALLVIEVMAYSDTGFQVVYDAGLCSTLIELFAFDDSLPLDFAFRIIHGCPTKHRKRLLVERGLPDRITSLLRYQSLHVSCNLDSPFATEQITAF